MAKTPVPPAAAPPPGLNAVPPPGLTGGPAPNLQGNQIGTGLPTLAANLEPYGHGPAPQGVRVGGNDFAQMNMDQEPGDLDVRGDAVPEDDFEMPPAIDREEIEHYGEDKNLDEWLTNLGVEAGLLIEDGASARRAGLRDSAITAWRRAFECYPEKRGGPWPTSSRIVPPDLRAAVETTTAREVEALFNSRERIRIRPRDPNIGADPAQRLQKIIQDFFEEPEINLRLQMSKALLTAHVDGMVVCETFWRREKQHRRRRVRVTNVILQELGEPIIKNPTPQTIVKIDGKHYRYGQMATIKQEVVTRHHFDFQFHGAADFFMFPATATSIDAAVIAGYEFFQTKNEIQVHAANGIYDQKQVDKLMEMGPEMIQSDPRRKNLEEYQEDDEGPMTMDSNEGTTKYGLVAMRRFWARMRDVNDDGLYEDLLITEEKSTNIIVSVQVDPYDNLRRSLYPLAPDPRIGGQFYAYSLVEKALDAHMELTALARQGVDMGSLAGSILIPVDSSARRSPANVQFQPGARFWREDMDGKLGAPVTFPIVSNQSLANRDKAAQYIEKITGASEILTGATAEENKTLGETNLQITSSGIRAKMMLLSILDFLTWLYTQFRDYCQQFLEETPGGSFQMSLGPGRGFEPIDMGDLMTPCSITAYSDAIDPDMALRAQMAEKILTLLMQSPFTTIDMARMWQVAADYLDDMGYSRDLMQRIGTKEQATAMQQQQAQQKQQAMLEAQQNHLNVPTAPPNMTPEFLALLLTQNPTWAPIVIPMLLKVMEAINAGKPQPSPLPGGGRPPQGPSPKGPGAEGPSGVGPSPVPNPSVGAGGTNAAP